MSSILSGWGHLIAVVGGSFLISLICLLFISNFSLWHLLTIPITIIVANFVEYAFHRWPMHQAFKPLKQMYKTHSGKHHRYFNHIYMNIECEDDMHEVFATPLTVFSFIFFVILPLALILIFTLGTSIALLFIATTMAYYGLYELIHFCSHLHPDHCLSKIPFMKGARERHQLHHNTRLMREWNFNIGLPLMDIVFRTLKK